ncbi:uncharacterized protein LOC135501106 [Lineus longissimus]|uniref:uncharacterized protein LOC135501106 n=1 Tax=Lineus longissimus TaxID=88925 RepID=UPI00315CD2ED
MFPNNGPTFNGPPMRNAGPQQGNGPGNGMQCGPPQRPTGPPGQCGPGPPGPGGGLNRAGPCGGPSGPFPGGQQGGPQFGGQQQMYGGPPQGQCAPQQFGNPRNQGPNQGPGFGGPQQGFGGPQQSGMMGGPQQCGPQQSGPCGPQSGPYGACGSGTQGGYGQGQCHNGHGPNCMNGGCNFQGPNFQQGSQGQQVCNHGPNCGHSGWNGPPHQSNFASGGWGQNGPRPQGPCGGPGFQQGNMGGPQGNMNGPQGNMGGPQCSMSGQMCGPNMNGPQGNFNGPQGNMNAPQGNMSGPPQPGNIGGPPQGNMNGPQNNFSGPQGNMNGPQGNVNSPQGNLGGPPQGNRNGPQSNFSGPQGNMNGPQQGNMSGQPPRPQCCPGQQEQFHQCQNNGPQQTFNGPNNQPPRMSGQAWGSNQGQPGNQGNGQNWGNNSSYQGPGNGPNWSNNQGMPGPNRMGPSSVGPPNFQGPPCDGPPGPRGPPPGCDGPPGPGPQTRYDQPPGPRGAPPGCDGPPQNNQPNAVPNVPNGPQQYDGPLGPRGPPPGSDGPPSNRNSGVQEHRVPPPGYDGPPGPRGPPPGSDGPPPTFEDPQRNWGAGANGGGPIPWPQQNNTGAGQGNPPLEWGGQFPPQGQDERPPPPGCDQEREPPPNQGWRDDIPRPGAPGRDDVFDRPVDQAMNVDSAPRDRSRSLDGFDNFYRQDDFDIDITRVRTSPDRGRQTSPNCDSRGRRRTSPNFEDRGRRRTSPNWGNMDLGRTSPNWEMGQTSPNRTMREQGRTSPNRDRGRRRTASNFVDRERRQTSPNFVQSERGRTSPRGPRRTSPQFDNRHARRTSPNWDRDLAPPERLNRSSPQREWRNNRSNNDWSLPPPRRDSPTRINRRPPIQRLRRPSPDNIVRQVSPTPSSSDLRESAAFLERRRSKSPNLARRLSPARSQGSKMDDGSYWTDQSREQGDKSRSRSRQKDGSVTSDMPRVSNHNDITRPEGRSLSPALDVTTSGSPRKLGRSMPGGRIVHQRSPETSSRGRYFQVRDEVVRSHSVERLKGSRGRPAVRRRGSDSTDRRRSSHSRDRMKNNGSGDARPSIERKRKRPNEQELEALCSRSRTSDRSRSSERARSSDPGSTRSRSIDVRSKRSKPDNKTTGNDTVVPSPTKATKKTGRPKAATVSKPPRPDWESTLKRPVTRRAQDGKQFEIPTVPDTSQPGTSSTPSEQQVSATKTSQSESDVTMATNQANQSEKSTGKAARKSRDIKKSRLSKATDAQKLTDETEGVSSDGSFSYDPSPERFPIEEEEEEECVADHSWMRSSPADLYFRNDEKLGCVKSTKKMVELEKKFYQDLVKRNEVALSKKPKYTPPERRANVHLHCHHQQDSGSESCSSSESEDDDLEPNWMDELNRKKEHPYRLHDDLWYNEHGEMNDGPLCRCSIKARRSGIRHSIYPGEGRITDCQQNASNTNKLFHYRITMSPHTNFLTKNPTVIEHDDHEYIFDGFSLFSHYKLGNIPLCKVIRFNIEYTIHFFEEPMPVNFSTRSLDLFVDYLFSEILELLDLDWYGRDNGESGCKRFHLMPRFVRSLPENGREILSMNEIVNFLVKSSKLLVDPADLEKIQKYEAHEWQDIVDSLRGMIVIHPGMKPSSIRVDQFDRHAGEYPVIVHFGIKPAQLSYAGDPNYQKLWKQYAKYKHLLANKPKVTPEDKMKLNDKEDQLQEIRMKSTMKREVTVEISGEGFIKTGIRSDMCQHALLLPVLISHLRFHRALDVLERQIDYRFKDRNLLQRALTHPSYRVNYGTNPDHARNSLSNCGIRQPEFGDRKIHHVHSRKRGINTLINIMSRMGNKHETDSEIHHYERLEFLGDAVVEFVSSIHLFFMFPDLDEGGLATFRAALVQNQHLAVLAKTLHLQEYMLYAHGPDLCHDSDLRHAMANCLEALMGALFLDGGIELADRIFASTLFDDKDLHGVWEKLPQHPLQEEEPSGDRHWIKSSAVLQNLLRFEDMTGIEFNNIRLLARAFTPRNLGFNNLTLGHNQRLEFLGDTVLQLIASEYLFKHFPEHHEGHLSLLRSSLVNNRTQSVVCDDLGMTEFVSCQDDTKQKEMKMKEKADLLEAFIGALYVDKGLDHCKVFAQVCFFPRLKVFIMNQEWNDPKSQLQQCCLTLRELDGGEPDIPIYKVLETTGPTNTRRFTVAVYFRGTRLATGSSHSIQQAEMNAATNALSNKSHLFPQLSHQKMFIEKKYHQAARRAACAVSKSQSKLSKAAIEADSKASQSKPP